MVAHPQPARGVDRGHVPPRLHLVVGVDRVEQSLESAVAARRRADADLGERLARRQRRVERRVTPAGLEQHALADAAARDLQRGAEQLASGLEDQQRPPAAAAPARRRARTGARPRPPARAPAARSERVNASASSIGPASRRSDVALPPTATASAGCGTCDAGERSRDLGPGRGQLGRASADPSAGSGRRDRPTRSANEVHQLHVVRGGADDELGRSAADVDHARAAPRARGRACAPRRRTRAEPPRRRTRISTAQPAALRAIASTSSAPFAARRIAAVATARTSAAPSSRASWSCAGDDVDDLGDLRGGDRPVRRAVPGRCA